MKPDKRLDRMTTINAPIRIQGLKEVCEKEEKPCVTEDFVMFWTAIFEEEQHWQDIVENLRQMLYEAGVREEK